MEMNVTNIDQTGYKMFLFLSLQLVNQVVRGLDV